jgi:hypothetical protein
MVQAAVTAGQTAHLERAGLKKERVLEEYRRIAFLDPRGFWEKVTERSGPAALPFGTVAGGGVRPASVAKSAKQATELGCRFI